MTTIPTAPDFWTNLRATRDATLGYDGPVTTTLPADWKPNDAEKHAAHKKMGWRKAIRECEACGLPKLRKAALEPEYTNTGRLARVMISVREKNGLPT